MGTADGATAAAASAADTGVDVNTGPALGAAVKQGTSGPAGRQAALNASLCLGLRQNSEEFCNSTELKRPNKRAGERPARHHIPPARRDMHCRFCPFPPCCLPASCLLCGRLPHTAAVADTADMAHPGGVNGTVLRSVGLTMEMLPVVASPWPLISLRTSPVLRLTMPVSRVAIDTAIGAAADGGVAAADSATDDTMTADRGADTTLVAVVKRKRRQQHNHRAKDSRKRQRQAERLSAALGSTPGPGLHYDG